LLGFGATQLPAQTNALAPRLTGIVSLSGTNTAWLDITDDDHFRPRHVSYSLSAGQSERDLEIVRIQPDEGLVEGRYFGTNFSLIFGGAGTSSHKEKKPAPISIRTREASWGQVVSVYQRLMHRSALYHVGLAGLRFTMDISTTNSAEACRLLGEEFRKQGVATVLDGTKFFQLVFEPQVPSVKPGSANLSTNSPALVPAGMIDFRGVEAIHVAMAYGHIVGLEFERFSQFGVSMGHAPIVFYSQTPLNREEAAYALETLLRLDGLAVERVGEKAFKLVDLH
jgi:hypothetical protein